MISWAINSPFGNSYSPFCWNKMENSCYFHLSGSRKLVSLIWNLQRSYSWSISANFQVSLGAICPCQISSYTNSPSKQMGCHRFLLCIIAAGWIISQDAGSLNCFSLSANCDKMCTCVHAHTHMYRLYIGYIVCIYYILYISTIYRIYLLCTVQIVSTVFTGQRNSLTSGDFKQKLSNIIRTLAWERSEAKTNLKKMSSLLCSPLHLRNRHFPSRRQRVKKSFLHCLKIITLIPGTNYFSLPS